MQRASVFQGISLKKRGREREREKKRKARGDQASSVSQAHYFYFQKGLLYLNLYIEGYERCKVIQSQPKHYICFVFIKTRTFSAYLFHQQCCVHHLLALEACEHFMTLLIKAAQPENLFSLEMFFIYISNLCQPQKTLNRVTFLTEQRCSELQQRKNQLAQRSDVVNSKVTLVFLTFQLC